MAGSARWNPTFWRWQQRRSHDSHQWPGQVVNATHRRHDRVVDIIHVFRNEQKLHAKGEMCNSCWCPSVIQNVIERPPFPSYLLAVDNSNNSMEDIVEVCVANDFTPQSKQTLYVWDMWSRIAVCTSSKCWWTPPDDVMCFVFSRQSPVCLDQGRSRRSRLRKPSSSRTSVYVAPFAMICF